MIQHLTIPRGPINLAADLHLPDNADSSAPLRAVVLATPGSSVKEQIGANYASRLAARGIAALVLDPAHQGQSEGEPRDLEDPYRRGEDISYAIDALTTTPGIDPQRIGVLGICAGGGYAVHTARTDHRIKAVGTVVPVNIGAAFRSFSPDGPAAALDALADARTEEARSGETTRVNWLPDTLEDAAAAGLTDIDTTQAVTYYRTERGGNEHSTNRRLLRSDSLLLGYDAFHLADQLMTQPLQVILAGRIGNTGSYDMGMQLWKLAPNPVDLMVIDGAGHYEMYDEPAYVDAAVERLISFYANNLGCGHGRRLTGPARDGQVSAGHQLPQERHPGRHPRLGGA
ncbi:alpha/beta hydrolase [Streptomyces fuscichromogenes]|uniref:Alpha/beta hydrolase n=1 Tax=Streptomyces fuscichromogenes TaxID=1324013 RepID=A0A918CXT5_9ACTN|nr:alpha/beta hydrolase [Streptomyces fuscichromogenes]GGN46109.1 alpha/beta hydrolase [Streptomyces fuscichromogenes]